MAGFFRDYGTWVTSSLALINGFIALIIAQFFKDRHIAKVILVSTAAILGVAAIGVTFYSQHQIVAQRDADNQRRKEIRTQLGAFIGDGLGLMNSCSINTEAPRWKETNEWRARIIGFLDARLDHSFVTRFNDPTGIPVNVDCRNADAEHNLLYHLQYATNFRLEEFSKEPNF